MFNFLIKKFIADFENTNDIKVIQKYGFLSGAIGIFSNFLLFLIKFIIGFSINSISVMADAINNLSDVGTSLITVLAFYITGKPSDEEHPYGHGRAEYIAAFILSLMIFLIGFQFLKSSFNRIFSGEHLDYSNISVVILMISVSIKLFQFKFYKYAGDAISSKSLIAASLDAKSDIYITLLIVFSLFIGKFIKFPIDGYLGILVSILIIYNGYKVIKDVIDSLLGTPPDENLVKDIICKIKSVDGIMGCHDLVIHNYGVGRIIATAHAEVSDKLSLIDAHNIIDTAEIKVSQELGINLLLHMDPIDFSNDFIKTIFDNTKKFLQEIDSNINIHDFRLSYHADDEVIFDIYIPSSIKSDDIDGIIKRVENFLKNEYNIKICNINVEHGNIII